MSTGRARTCDVHVDGAGRTLSLEEAHTRDRMNPKRCPACHGPVVINGACTLAGRHSLSHRVKRDGRPHSAYALSGVTSPHPQALASRTAARRPHEHRAALSPRSCAPPTTAPRTTGSKPCSSKGLTRCAITPAAMGGRAWVLTWMSDGS